MENFFIIAETEINAALIVINMALVTVLLFFVAWVYNRTHTMLSYSQSSLYSIMLMGILSCVIIMVITQNVFGAFAFFIIFTLIRFRSIMKETRDAVFLLFALIIGVAVGYGHYTTAITATIAISFIIATLNRWKIHQRTAGEHLLVVRSSAPISFGIEFTVRQSADLPNNLHTYVISTANNSPRAAEHAIHTLENTAGVEQVEFANKQEALEY